MKQDFIYTETKVLYCYDNRIFVDRNLIAVPADRRGKVTFVYRNTKTGKESVHPDFDYQQAICLAERRALDRRYRNFEFIIY